MPVAPDTPTAAVWQVAQEAFTDHGLGLQRAREFAVAHYDLQRVCLPLQQSWIADLAGA